MALEDTIIVFVLSLLVGTIAILAGARLIVDADAGFANAAFTAIVGAVVWAGSSLLVDWAPGFEWIPLVGALLMLVLWVGAINWRYPGGWMTATAIGFVAWIVAVAIVYALSMVGVVTPDALGVPDQFAPPGR